MYLLNTGIDRTEVMSQQHFYRTGFIKVTRKDVTNCNTCYNTQNGQKKHGRLLVKEDE